MSYSIIGFGKIGQALAKAFAPNGIEIHGGKRVVFLASDDDAAAEEIGAPVENLGFAPTKLGGLAQGGLLVQARGNTWGQLIFKDLVKFD